MRNSSYVYCQKCACDYFTVSRNISKPNVIEIDEESPLAAINVSWTVSFSDQMAAHFYNFNILYDCDEEPKNQVSPLRGHHFAIIKALPRNISCRISIIPTALDENVPIDETSSVIVSITTSK